MHKRAAAAQVKDRRKQTASGQAIAATIQALELRAHRAGLTVTAHALNNAKNAIGWEMAGDLLSAGRASRGERKGE